MRIGEIVSVNMNENGIHIKQSVPDDRILLQLLIDRRNLEEDHKLKRKIQDLIQELYG